MILVPAIVGVFDRVFLVVVVSHASGSWGMGRIITSVCLSMLKILKMAWAINTELGRDLVYSRSFSYVDPEVKILKVALGLGWGTGVGLHCNMTARFLQWFSQCHCACRMCRCTCSWSLSVTELENLLWLIYVVPLIHILDWLTEWLIDWFIPLLVEWFVIDLFL